MLAALQCLHGFSQSCTGFGPIVKSCVEGVCEQFRGSYWHRPQRDTHTLDPCSQERSSQPHNSICCYLAAGLWVQPEVAKGQRVTWDSQKLRKACVKNQICE